MTIHSIDNNYRTMMHITSTEIITSLSISCSIDLCNTPNINCYWNCHFQWCAHRLGEGGGGELKWDEDQDLGFRSWDLIDTPGCFIRCGPGWIMYDSHNVWCHHRVVSLMMSVHRMVEYVLSWITESWLSNYKRTLFHWLTIVTQLFLYIVTCRIIEFKLLTVFTAQVVRIVWRWNTI